MTFSSRFILVSVGIVLGLTLEAWATALREPLDQAQQSHKQCRVFPDDADWPSSRQWDELNKTVNGALLDPNPRFSVCHAGWPDYDEEQCLFLYNNYGNLSLRVEHPTDIQYPYFQGRTCLPSLNASTPCTFGGYPQYVVNVSNAAQIGDAIRFAKDKNMRLVIKNTGHDISGKSTGAGALSIWTHNLKQLDFIEHLEDEDYQGPAVRAQAGVELSEFYQFAEDHGVTLVGGECDTVGVAGGYLAGGGHSPIGGLFGMGADQIVSLTAVLANSSEVQITNHTHPDLFWALRGGGGSTFGVVTSVTVKAYPPLPATVDQWFWATTSADTFWAALRVYFDNVLTIADADCQAMLFPIVIPATNATPATYIIDMYAFFAPNKTPSEYAALTAPLYNGFASLGVNITQNVTHHETYLHAWSRAFPKLNSGSYTGFGGATASRLVPRANFEDAALANTTFAAIRTVMESLNSSLVFYAQRPSPNAGMYNAINPAYRDSAAFLIFGAGATLDMSNEEIDAVRRHLTEEAMPAIREVTPGGGTYVNEADAREPEWQESFWGGNYERLAAVKKEVDPEGVFWAWLGVGSEEWSVDGNRLPEVQNGRLCRKVAG